MVDSALCDTTDTDTVPGQAPRIRLSGRLVTILGRIYHFAGRPCSDAGSMDCAHFSFVADLLAGFWLGDGTFPALVSSRVSAARLAEGLEALFTMEEDEGRLECLAAKLAQPGAFPAECRRRRDALPPDKVAAVTIQPADCRPWPTATGLADEVPAASFWVHLPSAPG